MDPLPLNRVLCGDCAELLQGFPSDSVDLVVTDPPYGLSFMGKEWDKALPPREAFQQIHRVLKPGALAFVMSSPRQDLMWRMMRLLEESGFELRQSFISWVYKTGFPKAYDVEKGGASEEWKGWKSITGLKPALEPILMVNKSMSEATIVDNVLRWGTGAINVDACRIPIEDEKENYDIDKKARPNTRGSPAPELFGGYAAHVVNVHDAGRFPANLVVSDGALDTGEISKSGLLEEHHIIDSDKTRGVYGKYNNQPPEQHSTYGDLGDQSRYFDLDAWAEHHGILDVPKPDSAERDYGLKGIKSEPKSKFNLSDGKLERFDGAKVTPRRNTHPTVKPVKLMAYLIELGGPPDGVVMDPFLGSGTTCIAAKQLKRRYIGIEVSPEYCALAEARIAAYPQPLEWFDIHSSNDKEEK